MKVVLLSLLAMLSVSAYAGEVSFVVSASTAEISDYYNVEDIQRELVIYDAVGEVGPSLDAAILKLEGDVEGLSTAELVEIVRENQKASK